MYIWVLAPILVGMKLIMELKAVKSVIIQSIPRAFLEGFIDKDTFQRQVDRAFGLLSKGAMLEVSRFMVGTGGV